VDSLAAIARENSSQQRDRDLRLDVCRGIALWFIFLDHVPGNIGSWFTLSHYGFSDTTELFMFVSGVTCALAYGEVHRRDGWFAVLSHTLRRSWQIYVAFLTLTIACVVMVYLVGDGQLADETNTQIVLERPGPALAHALTLKFRPVNTDVLPIFVLFHLSFAPLLWLLVKSPNLTLGAALLLYLLVQTFGWNLSQWPRNEWYFNPLAWQFLVVLGAWWVTIGRKSWQSLLISPVVTAFAALCLLFALLVALSWSIKPLGDMMPQILAKLIYPIDKSDLDPLRLLHFLAIALLVARLVGPDWRGLTTPVLRSAVRCGENSLEIYCVGVLLSLAAHVVLVKVSDGLVMQAALSLAGVAAMIAIATLLTRIKIASRGEPRLF
jgi:hypothetical protein